MTDLEFDILDELYFIIHFDELKRKLDMEEMELKAGLAALVAKDWVRCYLNQEKLVDAENLDFQSKFRNYFYLATKKGLFAHNSV